MRFIASKPPTCPSRLQPVHQAKSCLDLLHLSHMTQCHVSYAMSSFITCVSLATNPSHLHCHGMSCSHKCICGLITCVSHIKHILVHLGCPSITKTKLGIFQVSRDYMWGLWSCLVKRKKIKLWNWGKWSKETRHKLNLWGHPMAPQWTQRVQVEDLNFRK
jgi:hypothetical protein